VRIVLENSYGTVVDVIIDRVLQAGRYEIGYAKVDGLISGIYYFSIYINGELIEKRMILFQLERE
jgi:hypothetical protein